MDKFIKIGKDLGLEGDKLLQFAEKKEAEAIEREGRVTLRVFMVGGT